MENEASILAAYHEGCQGDSDAYRRFADYILPRLRAFVSQRCNDTFLVDDILQNVLVQAYRSKGVFPEWPALRAWMYETARRITLDEVGSRKRERLRMETDSFDISLETLSGGLQPEVRLNDKERNMALRKAVERLPSYLRELFFLRFVESLSIADISSIIGHSPDIIYQYISRITKGLREYFKSDDF